MSFITKILNFFKPTPKILFIPDAFHSEKPIFKYKLIHEFARIPKKAHKTDSGYDISSCEHKLINAGEWKAIKTGVQVEIPLGWEIQIRPRSGLALNKGLTILNSPSTIDSDYRGELILVVINHGKYPFNVTPGDKLAQLVLCPVFDVDFVEVDDISTHTERGEKGFGSSGVNDQDPQSTQNEFNSRT